jgi:hypothetical protein
MSHSYWHGGAWRSGKGHSPNTIGDALAVILRSGQPALGAGERELLAELFAPIPPDAHNAMEGGPWKGAGHSDVVAVVDILRKELARVGAIRKNVIVDTAKRFRISVRTVEEYEAMTKKRENAVKKINSLYGQPPA